MRFTKAFLLIVASLILFGNVIWSQCKCKPEIEKLKEDMSKLQAAINLLA